MDIKLGLVCISPSLICSSTPPPGLLSACYGDLQDSQPGYVFTYDDECHDTVPVSMGRRVPHGTGKGRHCSTFPANVGQVYSS